MSITLNSPEFGSQHTVETFTIDERTAGEMLLQVKPYTWEEKDIFRWSFARLPVATKNDLVSFFCTNAGKLVDLQDDEARIWRGVVISKIIKIRQTHRNTAPVDCPDNSLWAVEFEFEGELQS